MYSLWVIPLSLVFIFAYLPMGGAIIAFKDYKYNLGRGNPSFCVNLKIYSKMII